MPSMSQTPASSAAAPSTASERTVEDGSAPMGIGTCRTLERVAAAVGLLDQAELRFLPSDDVPQGGLLCALPALLAMGLLRHTDGNFKLPKGFYPLEAIFMLLAYLALARVRSLEQIRYQAPGEWGKLLGLDRIPEVKTLREKVAHLSDDAARSAAWSSALAKDWMGLDPQAAGTLLVDGHIRVYHGILANLPRRYVSRERLCLRGTTDYWVNAMDGAPFFCITKAVDPGLIQTMEADIIPRLLEDIPGQPSAAALEAAPHLHRFTLIFDREGYSPDFFARSKAQRIACLSYHKHPGPNWDPSEFFPHEHTHPLTGEKSTLKLAERGTRLRNGLWVRELRKEESDGHQVSVLATDYTNPLKQLSLAMFSRWSQENYFKYMRQHYALDTLVEHGCQPLPDTTRIVNPAWRALDTSVRKATSALTRARAKFSAQSLHPTETTPEAIARHESRQGTLLLELQTKEATLAEQRTLRKTEPRHIELKDLPESERASQLNFARKHFMDTIKLIAYRAESALVETVREKLTRLDDARSLIRGLMQTTANLRPEPGQKILQIELHGQTNPTHDRVIHHLLEELNATQTTYPGTEMVMKFTTLRPAPFPADQDV
jgi:hypothetical protein